MSPAEIAGDCLGRAAAGIDCDPASLETLARAAMKDAAACRALFTGLVEPLADAFEPAWCEPYAALFSRIIAATMPEYDAAALAARYREIRKPRRFEGDGESIERVFVLSRVTLGADIAVTSVVMDAALRAFPNARLQFVGNAKNFELFAAEPRVDHCLVSYGRTAVLEERLGVTRPLRILLDSPASLVIDPDSRLTQLGLIPVCDARRYFFFESRAYGGAGSEPLSELAARWSADTFGVSGARPRVAVPRFPGEPRVCVSFGAGENPAKRIDDAFEAGVLGHLVARGLRVVVDEGAGGEEGERVRRAAGRAGGHPGQIEIFSGPFAEFAGRIAAAPLYVGYDSAGQHAASALGTPLVVVFAGFAGERMFHRWQPCGPGPKEVVRVEGDGRQDALARTLRAIDRLFPAGDPASIHSPGA